MHYSYIKKLYYILNKTYHNVRDRSTRCCALFKVNAKPLVYKTIA